VLPPPGPPVLPAEGEASPDPSWEEERASAHGGAGPISPLQGGLSPSPGGGFPQHSLARRWEPVCRTRRSCAAGAPASPPAQRLAGKGRGCLHSYGGPGAGGVPSGSPLRRPPGAGSGVCRRQPRPPVPAAPPMHWGGGLSREPRLGWGPARMGPGGCPSVCPLPGWGSVPLLSCETPQ